MRLLLIETAASSPSDVPAVLRKRGHIVDVFRDSNDAVMALRVVGYDLLLLDLSLNSPHMPSVIRTFLQRDERIPTVVLSSDGILFDRVRILDLGADDCMVRPFDLLELEARMRAILRRSVAKSGDNVIGLRMLRFDLVERSAYIGDARINMSPREIDLLETLMLRRGRLVTKAQIRGRLCGWSEELTDGAIELYVHRLRRRLAGSDVEVCTLRGFGYLVK